MKKFLRSFKRIIGIKFTKKYLLSQDLNKYQKAFKTRYDFILGLGESCFASQELRKAGLQIRSYPFDWCGAINWKGQEWPESGGG